MTVLDFPDESLQGNFHPRALFRLEVLARVRGEFRVVKQLVASFHKQPRETVRYHRVVFSAYEELGVFRLSLVLVDLRQQQMVDFYEAGLPSGPFIS